MDARDDVQGGSVAVLLHGQQRRACTIDANNIGLRRKSVPHISNVTNINGGVAHVPDGKIIQFAYGLWAPIEVHVILELSYLGCAGRQDQVLRTDGIDHVYGR